MCVSVCVCICSVRMWQQQQNKWEKPTIPRPKMIELKQMQCFVFIHIRRVSHFRRKTILQKVFVECLGPIGVVRFFAQCDSVLESRGLDIDSRRSTERVLLPTFLPTHVSCDPILHYFLCCFCRKQIVCSASLCRGTAEWVGTTDWSVIRSCVRHTKCQGKNW